jgi:hypothetical protein
MPSATSGNSYEPQRDPFVEEDLLGSDDGSHPSPLQDLDG